jgi:hypothetical protein
MSHAFDYPSIVRWLDAHAPGVIRYDLTAACLIAGYIVRALRDPSSTNWRALASLRKRCLYILEDHLKYLPEKGNWQQRVFWKTSATFQDLGQSGSPVVNCFVHHGYHKVFRLILRSQGINAWALIGNNHDLEANPHFNLYTFQQNELKAVARYLSQGGWLNGALDVPDTKPLCFQYQGKQQYFSSGAFRLAKKHGAKLSAMRLHTVGHWNVNVEAIGPFTIGCDGTVADIAREFAAFFKPVTQDPDFADGPHGQFVLGN